MFIYNFHKNYPKIGASFIEFSLSVVAFVVGLLFAIYFLLVLGFIGITYYGLQSSLHNFLFDGRLFTIELQKKSNPNNARQELIHVLMDATLASDNLLSGLFGKFYLAQQTIQISDQSSPSSYQSFERFVAIFPPPKFGLTVTSSDYSYQSFFPQNHPCRSSSAQTVACPAIALAKLEVLLPFGLRFSLPIRTYMMEPEIGQKARNFVTPLPTANQNFTPASGSTGSTGGQTGQRDQSNPPETPPPCPLEYITYNGHSYLCVDILNRSPNIPNEIRDALEAYLRENVCYGARAEVCGDRRCRCMSIGD